AIINEQSSNSIIINNKQSLDSIINTSESLLPIPIPEADMPLKRHCRYRYEYQGSNQRKMMIIVKKQCNTRSKRSRCPWVINATYPKKTDIISITSLYLEHGDHSLDPLTKKFDLSNAIQKVKAKQNVDYETATLINYLIEYKVEDIRWTINWQYTITNGLSKKAIQLGLNVGPSVIKELNNFIKNFITKYTPKQNVSKHNTLKLNIPKQNQKSPRKNLKRTLMTKSYNILSSSDESDGIDCSDSNYDDKSDESVPQDIDNIDPSSI
ncbi:25468_t:CDS:2, partial [Gigaspora rosea]